MKKIIPFCIAFIIIFYLLPFIITIETILFAAFPILILVTALIYGILHGFNILLGIACIVFAIPLLFIYGFSYIIYIVFFFIASLIGNSLGLLFKKK